MAIVFVLSVVVPGSNVKTNELNQMGQVEEKNYKPQAASCKPVFTRFKKSKDKISPAARACPGSGWLTAVKLHLL
jgi:hypothetical protein